MTTALKTTRRGFQKVAIACAAMLAAGTGATPEDLSRSLRAASERQSATLKAIGFRPE